MMECRSLLLSLVAVASVSATWHANAQESASSSNVQKAVLITGASSGIGKRTAEILSATGTFVYAGARKQADMDALNAMENVEAVRLDVTKQDEIDAAVEQIRAGGRGLDAIVNNAGVAMLGPLVEVPESDLEITFNVNVMGPYRITKAFLPLLLESKGRVINVSSVSGVQANMMFGTYSMSKHALEAYTDVLAIELQPFGVRVIAVMPGAFKSNMSKNGIVAMQARGLTIENSIYKNIPWDRIEEGMRTSQGPMKKLAGARCGCLCRAGRGVQRHAEGTLHGGVQPAGCRNDHT